MFEDRKLEWMCPIGGWGGGGGGSGMPDATGITDGYVLTADGDATPAWEAAPGAATAVTSPDGITTTKRTARFDIRDYAASCSGTDYFITSATSGGTTTVTTKTSAGVATTHDFLAGQGVYLVNSGPVCAISAPATTYTAAPWAHAVAGTSSMSRITVTDDANDRVTAAAGDVFATAAPVRVFGPGTLPTGLTAELGYFVRRISSAVYSFHPTAADASANTNRIAITGGSGPIYIDVAYTFTITDDANDIITTSSALPCVTAQPVWVYATTTLPTNLSASTTYYVRRATSTTFTFHPTALDATNNTNKIAITGGSGIFTIFGHTEYRYTNRCSDGKNAWTAATGEMTTFNWLQAGGSAACNLVAMAVSYGAHSVAWYGRGTSGRQLMRIMEASAIRADGVDTGPDNTGYPTFTATESSGGSTILRLTTAVAAHGVLPGDVIAINFNSSGDSGFNGLYLVSAVASSQIDLAAGSWNAGMASGTGMFERSAVEVRDYGAAVALQAATFLAGFDNQDMDWAADRAYPLGDLILDSAGSRLWRVVESLPDRLSGSSEPTWTSAASAYVQDNDNLMRREVEFVPLEDTSGATNQGLWTKVATVPTASTFTTVDVATADVLSNKLYCMHNDAEAVFAAQAAAVTFGRGAEIYIPSGTINCILGPTTDTRFWKNIGNDAQKKWVFLNLSNESALALPYGVSVVASHAAIVRCLCTSGRSRVDASTTGMTQTASKTFINFNARRCKVDGGTWRYDRFAGGFSEQNMGNAFTTGINFLSQGFTFSGDYVAGTIAFDCAIHRAKISFPQFLEHQAITADDNTIHSKFLIRDTWIHYGGGDGNGNGIPGGEFEFAGGGVQLETRNGSHGFYLNPGRDNINLHDFTMRYVGNPSKNCVQMRGSSGDRPLRNVNVSNIYFDRVAGPVRIGDTATSNRCLGINISKLRGRVSVYVAEARNVSITGGDYSYIQVQEDVDDLKLSNFSCDFLYLTSSDRADRVKGDNIDVRCEWQMSKLYNSQFEKITINNPHDISTGANLVNATYKWVSTGANQEYYCTLRATGGDPGLSSPAGMRIRDKYLSTTIGTVGALADGGFGYGSGSWGFNTIVVRMGDSTNQNPDNWPQGSVRTFTMTNRGLNITGATQNIVVDKCDVIQGLADTNAIWNTSGVLGATIDNVKFLHSNFWHTALPTTGTCRLADMSTTSISVQNDLTFEDCTFKMEPGVGTQSLLRSPFRVNATRGGRVRFIRCKFPSFGSSLEASSQIGVIDMIDCEIQTNVVQVNVDATANTFIEASGQPNFFYLDGHPIRLKIGHTSSSLPVTSPQVDSSTIYYYRNTDSTLYDTLAHAAAGGATGLIDVTTANGPVEFEVLDAHHTGVLSGYEATGDAQYPDAWREVRGNKFRGSTALTYSQYTSDQNNLQLWPGFDEHRLSTDAARTFTGFNASAVGSMRKRIRIYNVGAQNIVLAHASGSSATENQCNLPGATSFTFPGKTSGALIYDVELQAWILESSSAV